ncbi:hypothetical protein ACTXT7_010330 [Hymenolepis weldensis]
MTISDSESPGAVSSRKSPLHLTSGSSRQPSSGSHSVGIRKESIHNDQTPTTLKSSGTMPNENNSSETFNPNNEVGIEAKQASMLQSSDKTGFALKNPVYEIF